MLNASPIDANDSLQLVETLFTPDTPSRKPVLNDVSAGFSSIVQIARDVLANPDMGYRSDRYLQEQMTRDPLVMGPLMERKLSVAQLEWEVVPEDADTADDEAKEVARRVGKIIGRMRHQQDFFKQLLWADFRGTGASELNWEFDPAELIWYAKNSIPHHGDSVTFDVWGNARLLTRNFQTGGRELTKEEHDRLIIHVYQPDMGFFFKGEEAGYRFKGRGLRDIIWPYWWLAHNAVRFWVRFIQRFGMGFVSGRYPQGNAQAKNAIESVLRNLIEDSNVSIPVPADATDKESYGIEFHTMPGMAEKAGVFKEFVEDWAGKHIRLLIVGQEQAHQVTGDGLGSGRASALKATARMYRDDSAKALADTLTEQLVSRVQHYNFGESQHRLKFQFILEKDDYDQQEKRVKAAKDAGIQVTKAWVYKSLDIPQPLPGEDILDFGAMAMPQNPLFGGDPMGGTSPGDDAARMLFSEAIRGTVTRNE